MVKEFNVGDVVCLRSGGPRMTVESVGDFSDTGGPEKGVMCTWFDNHQHMKRQHYDARMLEKVE